MNIDRLLAAIERIDIDRDVLERARQARQRAPRQTREKVPGGELKSVRVVNGSHL